jgi:mono/diheme cytochrome c family protein
MKIRSISKAAIVVGLGVAIGTFPSQGQGKRTVWDGVYTADQATRGMATFKSQCAGCHGESMSGGGGAPAAGGAEFVFSWNGKTTAELFDYIKANMPPGGQGSISDQKYADIISAMLKTSEFPDGKTELQPDAKALAEITITKDKPQ